MFRSGKRTEGADQFRCCVGGSVQVSEAVAPATSDALLVTGTTLPGMLPLLLDKEPDPDPPDSGTVAIFLLPSAYFLLHPVPAGTTFPGEKRVARLVGIGKK